MTSGGVATCPVAADTAEPAGAYGAPSVPTRPVRVLHVFGRMDRGGAELRTLDVMRQLDPAEFTLEFCTLSELPGTLDDEIRALGGEVHPCPLGPRFPARFQRLLRERRIDVVHSHVQLFSGLMLRLATQAGIAVRVAHFRNTSGGLTRSRRGRIQDAVMRRWLDRNATHILGVNRSVLTLGWDPAFPDDPRCSVIYNGLDVRPYRAVPDRLGVRAEQGMPPDSVIVVHVGNMSEKKNHLRVVDIFAALATRRPSLRLMLVGRSDPTIERAVMAQVARAGLAGSVHLLGERRDVPRLLLAADLMIFPSRREGLPGAVLEARAAGLPVVASDLPGIVEIASVLPGVAIRSLDDPDAAWVAAAEAALTTPPTPSEREEAPDRMAGSPFGLDACVSSMTTIWRSAWSRA